MEDEQLNLLEQLTAAAQAVNPATAPLVFSQAGLEEYRAGTNPVSLLVGSFKSLAQSVTQGIGGVVGGLPELENIVGYANPLTAPLQLGRELSGINNFSHEQLTNAAEEINQFAARNITRSEDQIPKSALGQFLFQDVPSGIGSSAPGIAASFVNPIFGAGVFASQGAFTGRQAAEEADLSGTFRGERRVVAGAAINAAQVLPVLNFLRRANNLTGGAVKNALAQQILKTGRDEFFDETIQSLLESGANADLLDEKPELAEMFTKALYEGAVGAFSGAFFGGTAQVSSNVSTNLKIAKLQQQFANAETQEEQNAVVKKLINNPEISTAIDRFSELLSETAETGMTPEQDVELRELVGKIRGVPLADTEQTPTALYTSGFFGSRSAPDGHNQTLEQEAAAKLTPEEIVSGIENVRLETTGQTFKPVLRKRIPIWRSPKALFKQEIAVHGLFPEEVGKLYQARDQWYQKQVAAINNTRGMFERGAKEAYGSSTRISAEDAELLTKVMNKKEKATVLPQAIQEPAARMRGHIDALSKRFIDEGLIEDNLSAVIEENLGFYLNRQYRVFTDPKWADSIPSEIRNRFRHWARDELRDAFIFQKTGVPQNKVQRAKTRRAIKETSRREHFEGRANISTRELSKRLADPASQEAQEFENYITRFQDKLLYRDNTNPFPILAKFQFAKEELGLFKKRQDLPEPIRELMGEIKDPLANYVNTALRLSHALSTHKAATSLVQDGRGIFFFEANDMAQPEGLVEISSKGTDVFKNPFVDKEGNSLWTYPEIEREMYLRRKEFTHGAVFRAYMKFLTTVKAGLTVYAPQAQSRNFFGNAPFAVAHGHLDIFDPRSQAEFWKVFRSQMAPKGKTAEVFERNVLRATELGVLGQDVRSKELADQARDAFGEDFLRDDLLQAEYGASPWDKTARTLKSAKRITAFSTKLTERLYGTNDALWKYFGWQSEISRWQQVFPEADIEQVERFSGNRIRDSYPTYDNIPRITKRLRVSPLVASFPSFASEVWRVGWNGAKMIEQEIRRPEEVAKELGINREITDTERSAIRTIGAKRLAGHITALAGPAAITGFAAAMFGVDQEDEDDMRRFLAPWQQNNEIMITAHKRDETGKKLTDILDISYLDPFSVIKTPFVAAMRNRDEPDKAMTEFIGELFEPFTTGEIGTDALAELYANQSERGVPIYNPTASDLDKFLDMSDYLINKLQPGFLRSGRRIGEARRGEKGRESWVEWTALLGPRFQRHDPERALSFKASARARERRDIIRNFTDTVRQRREISVEELMSSYEKMQGIYREYQEELREDALATIRQGVTPEKTYQIMVQQKLGQRFSTETMLGLHQPYVPTNSLISDLEKRYLLGGEPYLRQRILVLRLLQQQVQQ